MEAQTATVCEQFVGPSPDEILLRDLSAIDWSFASRGPAPEIESIHPYPAKFIGDIPRTLINTLPFPKGSAVFDPFCGSGTTLVEAQRAGFPTVGIDLNPIACLITRVKTRALPLRLSEMAEEAVAKARTTRCHVRPAIPNVDHWFRPEIQSAVASIAATIAREKFGPWRDHLRLCLSSILVRVSNQESDTRYAAIDKQVSAADVYSGFYTAATKLDRALAKRDWKLTRAHVIEASTLEVKCDAIPERVGLVITSPPYPNAYEYWLYHKYRMWWLGFDPLAVKDKEIGARAHFFKKDHHTAELFVEQMRRTFALIAGVLVRHGFVCFIVGRSRIHAKIVDNAAIVDFVAREHGLVPVASFERVINPNRKSFNLAHANIKTETVLILRKA